MSEQFLLFHCFEALPGPEDWSILLPHTTRVINWPAIFALLINFSLTKSFPESSWNFQELPRFFWNSNRRLINLFLYFRIFIGLFIYFLFSIRNSSLEQLYCNVSGNDAQQSSFYNATPYYQQPLDNYQATADRQPDSTNEQSIELKSRQKYIDSSTMSILTTTSNPFLQTDLDTTAQFSKYTANLQDLSSIEEDSVTEDAAEQQDEEPEYDVRKNPFLMDY